MYVWWALRQRISRHNEHFAKFRYQEKRSSHITHVCRHHVRPNSCTCSHEREVSPKKSNGILAANAITVAKIKSDYVQYISSAPDQLRRCLALNNTSNQHPSVVICNYYHG